MSSKGAGKYLCVLDSIGKTAGSGASRQYWRNVETNLKTQGIDITVRLEQGAGFERLVQLALEAVENESFYFTQIVSFGNDLFLQSGDHVTDAAFELAKFRIKLGWCAKRAAGETSSPIAQDGVSRRVSRRGRRPRR